jgi:hypothetical protein
MRRGPVIAALVLSLICCNKGKRLIDTATKQHDAGDIAGAVTTLREVAVRAPKTPEVDAARSLAVAWLVEAFDAEKSTDPTTRRHWADDALTWDAHSGEAQARLCSVALDSKDFDGLRSCLTDGLRNKTDVPADRVAKLTMALKQHDEAEERANLLSSVKIDDWKTLLEKYPSSEEAITAGARLERVSLLASADPKDWLILCEKYPDSREAKLADDKLRRTESICADIDTFTDPARAELKRQRHVVPEFKSDKNKAGAYLHAEVTARHAAEAMRDLRSKVLGHKILSDESGVRDGLSTLFESLGGADQILYDEFKKGVDEGLAGLVSWDEEIGANRGFEKPIAALELMCSSGAASKLTHLHASASPGSASSASASASAAPSASTAPTGDGPRIASLWEGVVVAADPASDGTSSAKPCLSPDDDGFVDKRGGWGWGDRCWINLQKGAWGYAKAECIKGMQLGPASPNPKASLLYNLALIEKAAGRRPMARALLSESLSIRENAEVRSALNTLPP